MLPAGHGLTVPEQQVDLLVDQLTMVIAPVAELRQRVWHVPGNWPSALENAVRVKMVTIPAARSMFFMLSPLESSSTTSAPAVHPRCRRAPDRCARERAPRALSTTLTKTLGLSKPDAYRDISRRLRFIPEGGGVTGPRLAA